MSPHPVTDFPSNAADQIDYAARELRRSSRKRRLFGLVCTGQKRARSAKELAALTGWTERAVLTVGKQLTDAQLIRQDKNKAGRVTYSKRPELARAKSQILGYATNPKKLAGLATKTRPTPQGSGVIRLVQGLPARRPARGRRIDALQLSVFRHAARRGAAAQIQGYSEADIKEGFRQLIGEPVKYKDWGGERNDMFTTRLVVDKKRREGAFAFKGPGTGGRLTLSKLGKNGDQILRLYVGSAEVFTLQSSGDIDQAVFDEMRNHAELKAHYEQREIRYAVLDGDDTARIVLGNPGVFRASARRSRAPRHRHRG